MLWEMRQENEALRRSNHLLQERVDFLERERAFIEREKNMEHEQHFATRDNGQDDRNREEVGDLRADLTEEPDPGTSDEEIIPDRENHQKGEDPQQATVAVMLQLMRGMQEMQRQMMDTKKREASGEEDKGIEWARGGTQELPRITEWSASSGPIDLND